MINVRQNCFETNSSSTHNIVVVEDSQLEKWKNGELFFIEASNKFVTKYEKERIMNEIYGMTFIDNVGSSCADEIAEAIKNNELKSYIEDMINDDLWYVDKSEIPMTFKEWEDDWDNRDLEGDSSTYTTPKGEKIHIFCQFGYNG